MKAMEISMEARRRVLPTGSYCNAGSSSQAMKVQCQFAHQETDEICWDVDSAAMNVIYLGSS